MKLGEALQRRSDNLKRTSDLQGRIQRNALVQEGETPAESPQTLLAELERLGDETLNLIQRINRTNVATPLAADTSIADAIAERDHLTRMRVHYVAIAESATPALSRQTRSEIKYERTYDAAAARKLADDCAKARRELDMRIQQANWETDLVK